MPRATPGIAVQGDFTRDEIHQRRPTRGRPERVAALVLGCRVRDQVPESRAAHGPDQVARDPGVPSVLLVVLDAALADSSTPPSISSIP